MAFVFVGSQKVEQRFQAIPVSKHDGGKMAIEELNPISYRRRSIRARTIGIEGLKVQLQNIFIISTVKLFKKRNPASQ